MGYSNTHAQLMSAPPYIAGAISSLITNKLSDRFFWRAPFLAVPLTLIAIGYSIIISFHGKLGDNIGPTYFALVLVCIGLYPVQPAGNSWCSNNLAPANRRAVGIGLNVCLGNLGGIIGSFMYLEHEAPSYYTGFGLSLAFGATGLMNVLALETVLWYENKKRARVSEEEVKEKYTEEELLALGDKSPLFKYTL
jgi:MFS family permease